MTVSQARAVVNSNAREGEIIRVRGYLDGECQPRSCLLRERRRDRDAAWLSLGGGTAAEERLVDRRGKLVVLQARVGVPSMRKKPNGDITICFDRCPELLPIAIED